jgi:hypothetical protein
MSEIFLAPKKAEKRSDRLYTQTQRCIVAFHEVSSVSVRIPKETLSYITHNLPHLHLISFKNDVTLGTLKQWTKQYGSVKKYSRKSPSSNGVWYVERHTALRLALG